MQTQTVRIVDIGRGPQIDGHRITVMDVFYYLHRGHDFEFIHRAMPSLTRAEFDAVVEYVKDHRDELAKKDAQVEERNRRGIEEQKAKGLYAEIDPSIPLEQRIERLKKKARSRITAPAETNGGHPFD